MVLPTLLISAGFASLASATGVLLPLYVYPSAVYGDGAANWSPAVSAMTSYPSIPWLSVIDPSNGPGPTLQPGNNDQNYIDGMARLNALSNVKTIGYVRTNYATSPMAELQQNITAWKNWDSYKAKNISVQGIFFDESAANLTYMTSATSFARKTFGRSITTICNFGVAAANDYYNICDVVVAFESCLNCAGAPQYKSQQTISSNVPSGRAAQAAIIVNTFTGKAYDGSAANATLLQKYESTLKSNGVGWSYFCSGGYNNITTAPATVGANAKSLAS